MMTTMTMVPTPKGSSMDASALRGCENTALADCIAVGLWRSAFRTEGRLPALIRGQRCPGHILRPLHSDCGRGGHWRMRNGNGLDLQYQAVHLAHHDELSNGQGCRSNGIPKLTVDKNLSLRQ